MWSRGLNRTKLYSYTWIQKLGLRQILASLTNWADCHFWVTHTHTHIKLLLDARQAVL